MMTMMMTMSIKKMFRVECHKLQGQVPELDLDLDSSRIQVDALGYTLTPFLSLDSC